MKKVNTLLAISSAFLLAPSVAFAHIDHHDSCSINMDGKLSLANGELRVTMKNDDIALFTASGDVSIKGEAITLTRDQRDDAQQYYQRIAEAVPMTANIATDAVEIASVTVTEVFGELVGYDDDLTIELQSFFEDIDQRVYNKFHAKDGTFYIDSNDLENGQWVDQSWESEFEEKIESLVGRSIGRLLVAIGTEMIWGDGDTSAFEARMENFGDTIERRVTAKSEALEQKAEALCITLTQADLAENRLAQNVDALSTLDIFDVESDYRM